MKLAALLIAQDAQGSFPRHRAAASLKLTAEEVRAEARARVFRGIGPRPH